MLETRHRQVAERKHEHKHFALPGCVWIERMKGHEKGAKITNRRPKELQMNKGTKTTTDPIS